MDTTANRDLGRLVYNLLRGRMVEVGLNPPFTLIGTLGEVLASCTTVIEEDKTDWTPFNTDMAGIALDISPNIALVFHTAISMIGMARLQPGREEHVKKLLPFFDSCFAASNFRAIGDGEMEELQRQVLALYAKQPQPGVLGAAGDAMYQATMRPLRGQLIGKDAPAKKRRRRFLNDAHARCLLIEESPSHADRKAHGSSLGDMLARELRDSRSPSRDRDLVRFWMEFDLFFGDNPFIK